MEVNWKTLVKGVWKVVELIIAIVCIGLVAGDTFSTNGVCRRIPTTLTNFSVMVVSRFPFSTFAYTKHSIDVPKQVLLNSTTGLVGSGVGEQGALVYVILGVLTIVYCVAAIGSYLWMSSRANKEREKAVNCLSYTDLVFHIVWVLCWFIISIDWAVGLNRLGSNMYSIAESSSADCFGQITLFTTTQDMSQASTAVIFGLLTVVIWGINIIFVVIDTPCFIQWKAGRASYTSINN